MSTARIDLAWTVSSSGEARRAIAQHLKEMRPIDRADAALLASELVSERVATSQGSSPIVLTIERIRLGARVSVHSDAGEPDPAAWSKFSVTLLDRLTQGWGVEQEGTGWQVWFELGPTGETLAYADDDELFAERPISRNARDTIFERYQQMASYLAGRFGGRGEPIDDLEQVAAIGLVKAIDRFDPSVGVQFSTFASKTILGEIKRHFRDATWTVRVPRGLKELSQEVSRATGEMTQSLGRTPTIGELAQHLDLDADRVVDSVLASGAHSPASLDVVLTDESTPFEIPDMGFEVTEQWQELRAAIEHLPNRLQRVVYLRFFGDLSQSEIAEELGISQMHVSRLLTRALETIRDQAG